MLLSVIIVSYNTADLTVAALKSVFDEVQKTDELKGQTEVIVVDNNSNDDSVSSVSRWIEGHPSLHARLITNKENLGFSKANNQAWSQSIGENILYLNSDTQILPGSLGLMLDELSKPHIGIIAPQLLNVDGSAQLQGGDFPSLLSLFSQMFFLDDLPMVGKLLPSVQHTGQNQRGQSRAHTTGIKLQDWVGGTAMLVRREVLATVGGLDENIFMYAEDIEFCLRAAHQGWQSGIASQAKVVHLGSASSDSGSAIEGELKGLLYIWDKHKPAWQRPIAYVILKTGTLLRWFLFGTMGRSSLSRVYQRAWQKL